MFLYKKAFIGFSDVAKLKWAEHLKCLPRHLFEPTAEPLEHSRHVASLLHGDDASVVLLIDPDEESLVIVVPRGQKGHTKMVRRGRTYVQ